MSTIISEMLGHIIHGNASAKKTAYVLHGLLGAGKNLNALSKAIVNIAPDWKLINFDVKGHGGSKLMPGPNTLQSCVGDLHDFAKVTGEYPNALIGHSLGGKILLSSVAQGTPFIKDSLDHTNIDNPIQMFILDTLPGHSTKEFENAEDSIVKVLQLMRSVPRPIESRAYVREVFRKNHFPESLALWMASNIEVRPSPNDTSKTVLDWSFDPDSVEELFANHTATDLWNVLVNGPVDGVNIDFVIATKSPRWSGEIAQKNIQQALVNNATRSSPSSASNRRFPNSQRVNFHKVDAGHWVHAEKLDEVVAIMAPYFRR